VNDDLIARAKAAIDDHTWHDGEHLYNLVVDLVARCEQSEAAKELAEIDADGIWSWIDGESSNSRESLRRFHVEAVAQR